MAALLYPDIFRSLESVRWNLETDVPWDVQRAGIVDGLKRAGDIAAAGGVTITFEPLSDLPRRALPQTARYNLANGN